MTKDKMPIDFTVTLKVNPDIDGRFAEVSEEQKRETITRAHATKIRDEMQSCLNSAREKR